jgi:hypothetical protein
MVEERRLQAKYDIRDDLDACRAASKTHGQMRLACPAIGCAGQPLPVVSQARVPTRRKHLYSEGRREISEEQGRTAFVCDAPRNPLPLTPAALAPPVSALPPAPPLGTTTLPLPTFRRCLRDRNCDQRSQRLCLLHKFVRHSWQLPG